MRLWYLVGQGLINFAPTALAVWLLPTHAFGTFAFASLAYSWFVSLSLSMCLEVLQGDGWDAHRGMVPRMCLALGIVVTALVVALYSVLDVGLLTQTLMGLAVLTAGQSYCSRYLAARSDRNRGLILGDLTGLALGAMIAAGGYLGAGSSLRLILLAWIGFSAGVLIGNRWFPKPPTPRVVALWLGNHRDRIRPLLADSTLMDLSALGAPLLLGTVAGRTDFATYRSAQILIGPVNTVLGGVRLGLAKKAFSVPQHRLFVLACAMASVVGALAVWMVLPVAELHSEALSGLAGLELFVGIIVCGRITSVPCYLLVRLHGRGRRLLTGRLLEAGIGLSVPIVGFAFDGLAGGLAGASVAAAANMIIWVTISSYDVRTPVKSVAPDAVRAVS